GQATDHHKSLLDELLAMFPQHPQIVLAKSYRGGSVVHCQNRDSHSSLQSGTLASSSTPPSQTPSEILEGCREGDSQDSQPVWKDSRELRHRPRGRLERTWPAGSQHTVPQFQRPPLDLRSLLFRGTSLALNVHWDSDSGSDYSTGDLAEGLSQDMSAAWHRRSHQIHAGDLQPNGVTHLDPTLPQDIVADGRAPSPGQAPEASEGSPCLSQPSETTGLCSISSQPAGSSPMSPSLAQSSMDTGVTPSLAQPSVATRAFPTLAQPSMDTGLSTNFPQTCAPLPVTLDPQLLSMATMVPPSCQCLGMVIPDAAVGAVGGGLAQESANGKVPSALVPKPMVEIKNLNLSQGSVISGVGNSVPPESVVDGMAKSVCPESMVDGMAQSVPAESVVYSMAQNVPPESMVGAKAQSVPAESVVYGVAQNVPPESMVDGMAQSAPAESVVYSVAQNVPPESMVGAKAQSAPAESMVYSVAQNVPSESMVGVKAQNLPPESVDSGEVQSSHQDSLASGMALCLPLSFVASDVAPCHPQEIDGSREKLSPAVESLPSSHSLDPCLDFVVSGTGPSMPLSSVASGVAPGSMLVGISPRPYQAAQSGEHSWVSLAPHITSLANAHSPAPAVQRVSQEQQHLPTVLSGTSQFSSDPGLTKLVGVDNPNLLKPRQIHNTVSSTLESGIDPVKSEGLKTIPCMGFGATGGERHKHETLAAENILKDQVTWLAEEAPSQASGVTRPCTGPKFSHKHRHVTVPQTSFDERPQRVPIMLYDHRIRDITMPKTSFDGSPQVPATPHSQRLHHVTGLNTGFGRVSQVHTKPHGHKSHLVTHPKTSHNKMSPPPTIPQGPVDASLAAGQSWNSKVPNVSIRATAHAGAPRGTWHPSRGHRPWDPSRAKTALDHKPSAELLVSVRAMEKVVIQAIITIQARARGYLVRRTVKVWHQWATIIQATWRGYRVRRNLARLLRATTVIQAAWRGYCTRRAQAVQVMLPTLWPEHSGRAPGNTDARNISEHRCFLSCQPDACSICQSLGPQAESPPSVVMLVGSQPRTCHVCGHTLSTRVVQGFGQGISGQPGSCWASVSQQCPLLSLQHRAAILIQAAWKGYRTRRQISQQQSAAKMVQATWRGHYTRSCLTTDALLGTGSPWTISRDTSCHTPRAYSLHWPGV
ncbi:hypothetical protein STEG23_027520, partial [Scotinomys teguina]